MTKILITGAHFTPAVAIIEELKKHKGVDIVYIGRNTTREGDSSPSVESQVLPKLGVKFIPIIAGRLQKGFSAYTIPSLLKIPIGFLQALYFVLKEKPNIILSFGGYVAVPTVAVGWLLSIPIIIHEQTLVFGLASQISSFFADKIVLSFNDDSRINEKTIVTGNPLRLMITQTQKRVKKNQKPTILITGGNQGSHTINENVEKCLDKLTKLAAIIHISGDNKFKDFERLEKLQNEDYTVRKWIGEEYGRVLSKVDLVVSRAGINTLSELAYLGIPALVIPIPYLYKDEQNKNARFFEDLGLVKTLPQSKLSPKSLLLNLRVMLKDLDNLKKSAKEAKKVINIDAAKKVALETLLLA